MLLFLKINKRTFIINKTRRGSLGKEIVMSKRIWLQRDEEKGEELSPDRSDDQRKRKLKEDFFLETEKANLGICNCWSNWYKYQLDREEPEPGRSLLSNFFAREEAAVSQNDFLLC